MFNYQIINSRCEDAIPQLEDNSIDLVVTSPPYNVDLGNNKYNKNPYNLYNDNKDHQDYIDWLEGIFKSIYPKLKSGGRVVINVGDGKNGCYDNETEIMTKRGWTLFKDISTTDEVLTLNPDTKEINYELPSKIQEYDYKGKMYNFKSYTLDLCVTPNHRMMVERHHTKGWMIFEAQKLNQRQYKLPKALGVWKQEKIIHDFILEPVYIDNYKKYSQPMKISINNWLEFLGWYVTEGNCYRGKYSVTISQSPSANNEKCKEIINLIGRMNFNFCVSGKNIKISSKQLYTYLKPLGKSYEKYLPLDLSLLSIEQLQILFNTMIKGDGCKHNNGQVRYYTNSNRLADQMQIIALKLGFSTRVTKRMRKPYFNKKLNMTITSRRISFELTFTKEKNYNIDLKRNLKLINYDGKVYCCTTKNGIVYVRRNGTSVWCGNSIPTHSDIIQFMTKNLHYIPMTIILWDKHQTSNRCAWGSFQSPSSPSFPRSFEYIMIFAKETIKLQETGETDLTKEEFTKWSLGSWTISPEKNQKGIGHPAMFPVELPYRLIKMLSWKSGTVLDPFSGSGTTGVACKITGRKYIGIELSEDYCKIAENRIINEEQDLFCK
jgi:DNA modification methylase